MTFEASLRGRPNTVASQISLFNNHIQPALADSPETAQAWIDYWTGKGLAPGSIRILARVLNKYLEFSKHPTLDFKHEIRLNSQSVQETEHTVINSAQAEKLMEACRVVAPRFYPILLLGLHAGLRRGEIFGLRCGDVDVLKGRVRVAHSYDGPTKNGKTRYVPMSHELIRAMTDARDLLVRPINDRVFEKQDPNPMLRHICRRIGLPALRFHDLRHTYATLALESGVSPREVAGWLGHSSVQTTLQIYWGSLNTNTDVNSFLPGGNHE